MRILFLFFFITLYSCKEQDKNTKSITSEIEVSMVKTIDNPTYLNSQTPDFFSNQNTLWMSWLHTKDSIDYLKFAAYTNDTWGKTTTITSGKDWFVNWADFPDIAVNEQTVLTNILQKSDSGTYTYDIKLNLVPTNASSSSQKINDVLLHSDGTKSEHGFVSLQPYGETSFYAVWLDGRNTAGMDHETHTGHGGAMTLRGAIVSETGMLSREEEIDNRVCDCCQTDLSITKNKEILVAYRDRSEDEIRDIKIKKWNLDTGWSAPITVGNDNWKIAGCPVNGPALASFDNDYAVAWYSGANDMPKVQLAFGEEDSIELSNPITINSNPTMGRVDLVMISKTEAVVTWMEDKGDDTLIQLLKVTKDGTKSNVITVSKTSSERASGFPKITVLKNNIMMAFTLVQKDQPSTIITKSIAIDIL
ncbi:BNR repeat, putative [unidentified eubacterium SCB49]|nr:BNR repeat, putative [unidentified eubacterium SCB49]